MSVRSTLLAAAERRISNPFLVCVLVSQRTRQLSMAGNENISTGQLVNSALNELIAGALEFKHRAESSSQESKGGLDSPEVLSASAVPLSGEAP